MRFGGLLLVVAALSACRVSTVYTTVGAVEAWYAGIHDVERLPDGAIALSACSFDGVYHGVAVLVVDRFGEATALEPCTGVSRGEASIDTDASGRIYLASAVDDDSSDTRILSMDAAGGNRVLHYTGRFWPSIAVTPDGENLYFHGGGTNAIHRVTGPSSSEPVPGTEDFGSESFVVDADGVIYGSDSSANVVVKVEPGGERTIVAGNGTRGFSGDGGLAVEAQLDMPRGVDLTPQGNLLIADARNRRIRLVGRESGKIVTVAGGGDRTGWGDDGAPALDASIGQPAAVAADSEVEFWFVGEGAEHVHYSGVPDD